MKKALTFGYSQPLQHGRPDQDPQYAAHDTQHGDEVEVAAEIRGCGRREGEGETAGCEREAALGRDADGVAEGRVAEQRGDGDEEVGDYDGQELETRLF